MREKYLNVAAGVGGLGGHDSGNDVSLRTKNEEMHVCMLVYVVGDAFAREKLGSFVCKVVAVVGEQAVSFTRVLVADSVQKLLKHPLRYLEHS